MSLKSSQRISQKVTRSCSLTPRDPRIIVSGATRIQRNPVSRSKLSLDKQVDKYCCEVTETIQITNALLTETKDSEMYTSLLTTGSRGTPGPPRMTKMTGKRRETTGVIWEGKRNAGCFDSPGTWTGTKPKGKKIPRCLGEPPAAWLRGSAPPLWDTTAPSQCACPNPDEVPATAGWERTAAVPPEVYRCIAAASERAAAPHYRRDLEIDINIGCSDINRHHMCC